MSKGKHTESKRTASAKKDTAKAKAPKKERTKKAKPAPKEKEGGSTKKVIIAVALVLVLLAVGAAVGGSLLGKSDTVHPNLALDSIDIGGMTAAEAEKALADGGWKAPEGSTVTVNLPGSYSFEVSSKEAGLELSCAEAARAALTYGHSGNILQDLKAYFRSICGKVTLKDILVFADDEPLRNLLEAKLGDYNSLLSEGYRLDYEAETLEIIKGAENIKIDLDDLCKDVLATFFEGGKVLDYTKGVGSAKSFDFEALYEEIHGECVSAEYDPETHSATESSIGLDFDVTAAEAKYESAEAGELVLIPIDVEMPEHTTDELNEMLFRDKLGSQTTNYSSSSSNRTNNVELAASKINGVILNPGETFSYNDVVGQRTEATGFKSASAYAGGKVVQAIGGGICQVSSTLYCAALYANLQIDARDCHHFSVGYVPDGLDATVSWGGPEFKFTNNRDYPIKIVATYGDHELTVELWGTDVDGSYVEIDHSSWRVYDDEYPEVWIGTKAVTYRCVYDANGELISRTKEDNSYYHRHEENIVWPSPKPTQEPAGTDEPSASEEPAPAEETASVDVSPEVTGEAA